MDEEDVNWGRNRLECIWREIIWKGTWAEGDNSRGHLSIQSKYNTPFKHSEALRHRGQQLRLKFKCTKLSLPASFKD